jgi:hypothetical protein
LGEIVRLRLSLMIRKGEKRGERRGERKGERKTERESLD